MITDEDLAKALDRVARTADGELFYRYFQKVLMGILPGPDVTDGALRWESGRRSLAQEIMGLMAKGIEESAGRASSGGGGNDGQPVERPIVFVTKQPARVGGRDNFREWSKRNDPELIVRGDD